MSWGRRTKKSLELGGESEKKTSSSCGRCVRLVVVVVVVFFVFLAVGDTGFFDYSLLSSSSLSSSSLSSSSFSSSSSSFSSSSLSSLVRKKKEVIYVDEFTPLPRHLCQDDPFDVIVVLGGGGVSAINSPPEWVKRRIKKAAEMFQCQKKQGYILMLSAGTAHVPNFQKNGKPVYESFSSALYFLDLVPGVNVSQVVIETSSFDTITNAFFARTSNTDIRGWRRLLIITSDFHMPRSKDIFEHMFSIPITPSDSAPNYNLTYLSVSDRGLDSKMITSRTLREMKSLENWKKMKKEMNSLSDIHIFLSERHDLYAVGRLVEHYESPEVLDEETKISYGGSR